MPPHISSGLPRPPLPDPSNLPLLRPQGMDKGMERPGFDASERGHGPHGAEGGDYAGEEGGDEYRTRNTDYTNNTTPTTTTDSADSSSYYNNSDSAAAYDTARAHDRDYDNNSHNNGRGEERRADGDNKNKNEGNYDNNNKNNNASNTVDRDNTNNIQTQRADSGSSNQNVDGQNNQSASPRETMGRWDNVPASITQQLANANVAKQDGRVFAQAEQTAFTAFDTKNNQPVQDARFAQQLNVRDDAQTQLHPDAVKMQKQQLEMQQQLVNQQLNLARGESDKLINQLPLQQHLNDVRQQQPARVDVNMPQQQQPLNMIAPTAVPLAVVAAIPAGNPMAVAPTTQAKDAREAQGLSGNDRVRKPAAAVKEYLGGFTSMGQQVLSKPQGHTMMQRLLNTMSRDGEDVLLTKERVTNWIFWAVASIAYLSMGLGILIMMPFTGRFFGASTSIDSYSTGLITLGAIAGVLAVVMSFARRAFR